MSISVLATALISSTHCHPSLQGALSLLWLIPRNLHASQNAGNSATQKSTQYRLPEGTGFLDLGGPKEDREQSWQINLPC